MEQSLFVLSVPELQHSVQPVVPSFYCFADVEEESVENQRMAVSAVLSVALPSH